MKKLVSFISIGLIALFLVAGCATQPQQPKNVIFLIGDGMGVSQVTAGKITKGSLAMEECTSFGLAMTFSANNLVTDSAAGGTALATGHKTNNGMVGVTPDNQPVKNVFEFAKENGMATGLIATCSITHATPASFASHVESRSMDSEIAKQITAAKVDVMIGGGLQYFLPQSDENSKREDDLDLWGDIKSQKPVYTTVQEIQANSSKQFAALLDLGHPGKFSDRNQKQAPLVKKALEALTQHDNGFILMVEGSQIDWAGHANDQAYLVDEVLDFDATVQAAIDFAKNDGQTLVVVTADHETGGLAILGGSIADNKIDKTGFATGGHSATMVPVFAFGPGAELFSGIQDNTEIGKNLINLVSPKK